MQKKIVALSIAAMISSGAFAQSVNDGVNPVQVSPDGGTTLMDAGPNLVVPGTVTTGTVTSGLSAPLNLQGSAGGFSTNAMLDGNGLMVSDSAVGQTLFVSFNGTTTVGGDGTPGNTQAGMLNVTNGAGASAVSLNGLTGAVGAVDIMASGTLNVTAASTLNGALVANGGATVNGNLVVNGAVVNDGDVIVQVDNDNGGYGNFIVVDQNGGAPLTTVISNAQSTNVYTDGGVSLAVDNAGVTSYGLLTANNGSVVNGSLTANDGPGSLTIGSTQTSLGVLNAGGNLNGIMSNATQTTVTGGTASTMLTLNDTGMAVTDSGSGQTFQVSNSGDVQVGGVGSSGPNGTVSVSNGISNTIVLEGSTGNINVAGNITAAAGTITGASVNAGNVNVSGAVTAGSVSTGTLNTTTGNITNLTSTTATIGIVGSGTIVNTGSLTTGTLSTVGNVAIGANLGVTGATTMTGMLTADGGVNSGAVNINNLASGANNITHVNTMAARQGNFGNTGGTAGVVNIRDGAVNTIILDGASGQVSAGQLQVHTNGGVDVAGVGGLDVAAGGANIGVRNAANTAWNGLAVTDSSASLRGGTASTTLTLDNAGMTVSDTTNGQTLTVSNTGALRVGGNGTVGNQQAGTVNVTNTTGTSTITLNGGTGAITATSVTANAYNVANVVASDSITSPNAYLGGSGAEVDVAAGTAVTFNGNRLQEVGAATVGTDAVNLSQLNGVRNSLQSQISDNRTESRRGVAGASAIAGIPALDSGKQYNFGVGLGHYKGESALALGGNARFDAKTVGRLAVGFSGSDATVSAGVGWSF